jgi:hypothetical protein
MVLYLHSLIRLHDMMFSGKSTSAILVSHNSPAEKEIDKFPKFLESARKGG